MRGGILLIIFFGKFIHFSALYLPEKLQGNNRIGMIRDYCENYKNRETDGVSLSIFIIYRI